MELTGVPDDPVLHGAVHAALGVTRDLVFNTNDSATGARTAVE